MKKLLFLLLMLPILLSGCASKLNPGFESPIVSLQTFEMIPQSGISPGFEIGLNIINPNREALDLEGIYYTISIEGYKLLAGVSNDLPRVPAYGDANITLVARVGLLSSIRFFNSLLNDPRDSFSYSFNAKLDPGGFQPKIIIRETGEINLQGNI